MSGSIISSLAKVFLIRLKIDRNEVLTNFLNYYTQKNNKLTRFYVKLSFNGIFFLKEWWYFFYNGLSKKQFDCVDFM